MEHVKDTLCHVCGDRASGKHYGVPSCDGCRGFFKRSIRRSLEYTCKENGNCIIDVPRRNQCQACRFAKCLKVNMNKDAVQHERAPRTYAVSVDGSDPQNTKTASFAIYSTSSCHSTVYSPNYPSTFTLNHPSHFMSNGIRSNEDQCCIKCENEVTSSEEMHNAKRGSTGRLQQDLRFISSNIISSASKILMLAVRWAKSIPSFLQLCESDRQVLLLESWNGLFILSAVQWYFSFSLLEETENSENCQLATFQKDLKDIVCRFNSLQVDYTEFACLKALVLFKPEVCNLRDKLLVEMLQDQTQVMLHEYCLMKHGVRFGKLLLLLSSVNKFTACVLENLFFNKCFGDPPLSTFILECVH